MSQQTKDEFIRWLDELESNNGWTDYRLSIETGLSSSVFSKARQGILPKWDALVRIANAFKVSPVTAFRKAGLLPSGPASNVNLDDWEYLLSQMTDEEREDLREIGIMRIERRQKEKSLKSLKTRRAE